MTEYDYSPVAYERYIAKQNAIARWVDHTNHHAPANPFLPSESGSPYQEPMRGLTRGDAYNSDSEEDPYRSSSRHRHHQDRDRDRPRRPQYDRYYSHQASRNSSRKHSRSSSSRPSRSNTLSSSYTWPPANGHSYQYPPGHNQQQYPYNYGSSSSNPLSSPQPRTPYEQTNYPTLVPVSGGAGGYILVPPKGVNYQLAQPQAPQQTQPWYKRVFSPTSSVASGQNKQSSGSSRGKRSSKWSWDIY